MAFMRSHVRVALVPESDSVDPFTSPQASLPLILTFGVGSFRVPACFLSMVLYGLVRANHWRYRFLRHTQRCNLPFLVRRSSSCFRQSAMALALSWRCLVPDNSVKRTLTPLCGARAAYPRALDGCGYA